MGGGRRYDRQPKLNMKKVAGVVLGIAVIIMFIVTLIKLLNDSNNIQVSNKDSVEYFTAYENEKWGVIDNLGNIVINPQYDEMIVIPDKTIPVFICTYDVNYDTMEYKTRAINEKGEEIFTNYEGIEGLINEDESGNIFYEKNVYKIKVNNKYGLIDGNGKEILKCDYDDIRTLTGEGGTLIVTQNNNLGVADTYGNILIKPEYKDIKKFGNGSRNKYIVINSENKYGIVMSDASIELEIKYDDIKPIDGNNLYVVKEGDNWKVINKDNPIEVSSNFDDIIDVNNGNIIIERNNKYGVINTNGEDEIPAEYDDIKYMFGENYIAKQGNEYGIININNETKVEFKYDNIRYIDEAGIIIADTDEINSDIMNKDFKVEINGVLSDINIEKGYMKIRQDEDYKYYNFRLEEKKNTEILTKNTIFLDKKDGKYGYINNRGEVIVDYIYDDATEQNEYGFASVNKDGLWGSIDKNGNVVLEPTYDLKNNIYIEFIGQWHISADANANYFIK